MNTERYQRQIILSGFGMESQQRLADAKVLVIGAGGLGCPALQYLVAAGVGCIGVADHDVVELSNLQRQVLYGIDDIGLLKVDVAAKRLQQMNPESKLILHPTSINKNNVIEIISNYNLIFDGTDNFESRYLINDACTLLKKSLVFAAVSGFEGQIAVFNTPDEQKTITNYRDLFPVQPNANEIPNCAENGVLGVLPGIIGTMAAGEIVKLITGIGKPLINKLLHYNLLNQEQYEINISPSDEYKQVTASDLMNNTAESVLSSYTEIDAESMLELSKKKSTLLIDVRERHEFPKLNPTTYQQIPMSEFDVFAASDIVADNIILLCQHGIRSVAAAEKLHSIYGDSKKIYSLKGGIAKWRNHF
ncbi:MULTISPECIES: HesA/MoeB/ThiF family protein [Pedobacter]|uniref:HesA/MoeB/ThiF family protein n=1 Tax=Pedobacter TaxID=84567 RepID=UPI001E5843A0|nr:MULTISPECIES: HesA/MoeB/ThiF family protein [Pedobacter]